MRIAILAAAGATAVALGALANDLPQGSRAIFERRILPILRSPNPSSCAECHLSGVDLKDYILPTERETFASLRDRGLVDLKQPDQSHLLKLIRMSSPASPLVSRQAREAEYQAFRDWIAACAADPGMARAPRAVRSAGPRVPNAVIRHTRKDHVLASFIRNVWSQQGRCMGCHTPGTPENEANVKKYGERVRWFVPDSPEGTLQKLIRQKLINVDQPEQSLLLLKPLNAVPHGGGVKFLKGDAGYKQFRAWIEDYARSVKGSYRTTADLPAPEKTAWVYTDCILVLAGTPEPWGDRLVRVDAYPWDAQRGRWAERPAASGDRQVSAKLRGTNIWMWLAPDSGSAAEKVARRSPRLPGGRWLLKYYCDTKGLLEKDYRIPTDSPGFYQGSQEIESAWPTGWGAPTRVTVRPSR